MSDSDVLSVIGSQKYWILPEETINLVIPEFTYTSGSKPEFNDTLSFYTTNIQRIFDIKSRSEICVLYVQKNIKAIIETEGILKHLARKLKKQHIEPVDLVKRAWKTSGQNDTESSA